MIHGAGTGTGEVPAAGKLGTLIGIGSRLADRDGAEAESALRQDWKPRKLACPARMTLLVVLARRRLPGHSCGPWRLEYPVRHDYRRPHEGLSL